MSMQTQLEQRVRDNFAVQELRLLNESHQHSVPANSETHFKLTLVSPDFEGLSRVARHQKIYALTQPLMQQGLHALALHLYTPIEWAEKNGQVPASPQCMGGSKSS